MASLFAHGVAAIAIGKAAARPPAPRRFWIAAVVCSIFPDIDVLSFRFGIHYHDLLGHRGLTHSLAVAAVLGALAARLTFPAMRVGSRAWWGWCGLLATITASHGLLDAMTDGGLGVAFFAPFDNTRYFLPFRPIAVSPIGIKSFFSDEGLRVFTNELLWVWTPSVLIFLAAVAFRRRGPDAPSTPRESASQSV